MFRVIERHSRTLHTIRVFFECTQQWYQKNARNYTEICLYVYRMNTHMCDQSCGYLQGCKIQRLDLLKVGNTVTSTLDSIHWAPNGLILILSGFHFCFNVSNLFILPP